MEEGGKTEGAGPQVLTGQGAPDHVYRGRVFLGADGVPVTFQDMMAAVTASPAFQGSVTFVGESSLCRIKGRQGP